MSNISSSPSLLKKHSNIYQRLSKQEEHQYVPKEQNGTSTLNEAKNNNAKEDPQDDRVPCEFCGELRCKETIMRHQVIN